MTITTKAVYEQGVLKLPQPIPLAEGAIVEVIVVSHEAPDSKKANEILAKIAALPLEGKRDAFSGSDHDQVLYPSSDDA